MHLKKSAADVLLRGGKWAPIHGVPRDEWETLRKLHAAGKLQVSAKRPKGGDNRDSSPTPTQVATAWAARSSYFEVDSEGHLLFNPPSWKQRNLKIGDISMSPLVFILVTHGYITPSEAAMMGRSKYVAVLEPERKNSLMGGAKYRGPPVVPEPCPDHFGCINPAHFKTNIFGRELPIIDADFRLGFPVDPDKDVSVSPPEPPEPLTLGHENLQPEVANILAAREKKKRGPRAAHTPIISRLPAGYDREFSLQIWIEARRAINGRPKRRMQGFELPLPYEWWLDETEPPIPVPNPLKPYELFRFDAHEKDWHLVRGIRWADAVRAGDQKLLDLIASKRGGGLRPRLPFDIFPEFRKLEDMQEDSLRSRYGIASQSDNFSHVSCMAIWPTGEDPLPPLDPIHLDVGDDE